MNSDFNLDSIRTISTFEELSQIIKQVIDYPTCADPIAMAVDRYNNTMAPNKIADFSALMELFHNRVMFHFLVMAYKKKYDEFHTAYNVYAKAKGNVTEGDIKEYMRALNEINNHEAALRAKIDPENSPDPAIREIKIKNGKKHYLMSNSDIQNRIMIMSDDPILKEIKRVIRRMSNGKLGDTKRCSNKKLENVLENMKVIYTKIQNSNTPLIEKAYEYYVLEYRHAIEGIYRFLKIAHNVGRSKDELTEDVFVLKAMYFDEKRNVFYENGPLLKQGKVGNYLCLDMDLFFEMYASDPDKLRKIFSIFSILKREITKSIQLITYENQPMDIDKILDSTGAEAFLEQYTSWRHIDPNKKFSKSTKDKNTVDIKDFRDFYSPGLTIVF